jgi:nucleotide-binding universal stress UspA family protein
MRRILVAVDGTQASHEAARVALEYAGRLDARVTFLHVLPPRVAEWTGEAPDYSAFEKACADDAERLMAKVRQLGGARGPHADTVVEYGDPAEVILSAALAEDVDLLIVGARERGPVVRTLLGSVSADVVARCSKPVMVVPERLHPAEAPAPNA